MPSAGGCFGTVVFITSAVVLVLEMVAARLIAPYVGVSLYSWTSIIAVILAGLSIGNWLGGLWADKGARVERRLRGGGAFDVTNVAPIRSL